MNKYVKPTISLLSAGANTRATSSCTTSKEDAREFLAMLESMNIDLDTAFGTIEGCQKPIMFEDYCKFTSGIQIFFS